MTLWSRRKFFVTSLVGSTAASAGGQLLGSPPNMVSVFGVGPATPQGTAGRPPLVISSANGLQALDKGMAVLKKNGDTLDAAVAVVTVLEDDPNETSVGYGGLPNEDGQVELDASVMHGPTRRAGSVAAVRRIKNVARLAKTVMERSSHIMLVGPGATRFAVAQGFEEMNLVTEKSRLAWLAWKAKTSLNWRPGTDSPEWEQHLSALLDTPEKQALRPWIETVVTRPPWGTINCLAVNEKGEISGTTTTSGLAWKIAGRVGDSPIIGAGLYVDGEVGGAGSTGKGEENIKVAGAHTIVELMRKGKAPKDACLEALDRVAHNYKKDKTKLRTFHLYFYALNKDGGHGSASLWRNGYEKGRPASYAVHDGREARLTDCAAYFDELGGDQ